MKSSQKSQNKFKRSPLALAVVAAMAMNAPAQAQSFPAVVDVAELDGSDGFAINTEGANNSGDFNFEIYAIGVVSGAGDVNGDGVSDVLLQLVRSAYNDYDLGAGLVLFGGSDVGSSGEVNRPGLSGFDSSDGFFVFGSGEYDTLGSSISDLGDINGDGLADVVISAPGADTSDLDEEYGYPFLSGVVYVVFGGAEGDSNGQLPLSSLDDGTAGFRIESIDTNNEISNVSGAGDINGDGVPDLIIGSRSETDDSAGQSYIIFGGTNVGSVTR